MIANRINLLFLLGLFGIVSAGCKSAEHRNGALKSVSGIDLPFSSIGRGATMTLTKDIEVPANDDGIKFSASETTFKSDTDENNEFHKTWTLCGIQMKSATASRRVIPAGTVFNFTGEASSHPMDANPDAKAIDLTVSSPSDALQVSCMSLVTKCWIGICDPYDQAAFSIKDFKNYMSGTARVDEAPAVVVHGN